MNDKPLSEKLADLTRKITEKYLNDGSLVDLEKKLVKRMGDMFSEGALIILTEISPTSKMAFSIERIEETILSIQEGISNLSCDFKKYKEGDGLPSRCELYIKQTVEDLLEERDEEMEERKERGERKIRFWIWVIGIILSCIGVLSAIGGIIYFVFFIIKNALSTQGIII